MNAGLETTRYLQSIPDMNAVEITALLDHVMGDAVRAGASDIHLEPWETSIVVRMRLNGVLSELVRLPLELMDKISGRLKVMANLISYQSDIPQEGHAAGGAALDGSELRISVFPTVRGEKIVVRIFDPRTRSFDLGGLGLEESTPHTFEKLLGRPTGMMLLTGPTGSGKTTAMYAALSHLVQLHGSTISISTVEDPVEFSLPMVSQAQVNLAKDFTYARALRSLMRQDPQVIMVGEIRDAETAQIAVQAGLTGHLVLSTIHSGSTAGVFARLMNMEIEPFLLASSITGVLGLRLVRNNCPMCAAPYEPDALMLKLLTEQEINEASFRHGQGCETCMGTGYSGRSALTEMLVVEEVVRDAILQKMPTRSLQGVALGQGMRTLWQNGVRRVLQGESPLEEIVRVVAVEAG